MITLPQLHELCDDPVRDLPGGTQVRALLCLEPDRGFYLGAQDGELLYEVVHDSGAALCFRTIEDALRSLREIHGLAREIGLFQSPRQSMTPAAAEG